MKKMTKAEREAMKAYKADLLKQGIDELIADAMAQAMVTCKVIVPVVNSFE